MSNATMDILSQLKKLEVQPLVEKINSARSILLSTHKQCDGDGLGAQLALYHALKSQGKQVRILCVDSVPKKYNFLDPHLYLETYEGPHAPVEATDLAVIFDTNDKRLVEPLYSELEKKCKEIVFVDHHPILKQGPQPTAGSFIDVQAASTGEIAFHIIKHLGVELNAQIARALYTSIAFDTQIFRYVKNCPDSHLISAELLNYESNPEEIHKNLFSTHTVEKVSFLAKVLGSIEYYENQRVAVLKVSLNQLTDHGLDMDDTRDLIDMIMNIQTLEVAALFREDETDGYKLSLRSKGSFDILQVAENLGGGGHLYAAGAFVKGSYEELRDKLIKTIKPLLTDPNSNTKHGN